VVSEVCGISVAMLQVVTEEMAGTVGSVASMERVGRSGMAAQVAKVVFAA
jgi:hypothetical protein